MRRRELDDAIAKLSTDTGLAHHPSAEGEHVAGTYRQRLTLASGRFAMIDDGLGFQLVPWRPALEQKLGPEYDKVIDGLDRVDLNSAEGQTLADVFKALQDKCN